jgi:hypothetical protein
LSDVSGLHSCSQLTELNLSHNLLSEVSRGHHETRPSAAAVDDSHPILDRSLHQPVLPSHTCLPQHPSIAVWGVHCASHQNKRSLI